MQEEILEEDWLSPKVEIRTTEEKGRGIFAVSPIAAGEKIIIWGGEYVDEKKSEEEKAKGKKVMQWDENLYSVENNGESLGYFINHSCEPNTWMSGAFTIIARRDIAPGEEVTADYALWEARGDDFVSKWECKCGKPNCRKRITGKDWKSADLQERYKDHFSPLINKWIKSNQIIV
ncbi:MAG: SET domain-containing protein [Bacillota bacterium]